MNPLLYFVIKNQWRRAQSILKQRLRRKKLSISYHKCREWFVAGVAGPTYEGPTCGETKSDSRLHILIKNHYVQISIDPYSMCRCNLKLILLIISRCQRGE